MPRPSARSGFTLIELLVGLGIIGVLATIVIVAINPTKQLEDSRVAQRLSDRRTIEAALNQYVIKVWAEPVEGIPLGVDEAFPICPQGVTDPSCINLDVLTPDYLVGIPQDSALTTATSTAFRVYKDVQGRLSVCADGLPANHEFRCPDSTYVSPLVGLGDTPPGSSSSATSVASSASVPLSASSSSTTSSAYNLDLTWASTSASFSSWDGEGIAVDASVINVGPDAMPSNAVVRVISYNSSSLYAYVGGFTTCPFVGVDGVCELSAMSAGGGSFQAYYAMAQGCELTLVIEEEAGQTYYDLDTGNNSITLSICGSSSSSSSASCGDYTVTSPEECDEGGFDAVSCDYDCTLPVCGDSYANGSAGEPCDPGMGGSNSSCDFDCTIPTCGDSHSNSSAGEYCDDGGINTASCDADCTAATCGDNFINDASGEVCDGSASSITNCENDCTFPLCGDGLYNSMEGEQCDDGNTDPGDGCSNTCTTEVCGNWIVDYGEQCDDGGTMDGDGCDSFCQNESSSSSTTSSSSSLEFSSMSAPPPIAPM
jgi:prepilin-type N-terminal cleavage/methylation domain-containing protein